MKSALAFVIAIEVFNKSDEEAVSKDGAIVYIPLIILGSIPVICFLAIYKYRDRLEEQSIKDRIEKMYVEVTLTRNPYTKYIYPVFLSRRFLFAMIPIFFPNYPTF